MLDSPVEDAFDRFTRLASHLLNAPVALVSLVDTERQFFKSALGLGEPWASRRETPLTHSFCQYAVASREPVVIADCRAHPTLGNHPAISDLMVKAYAGYPLILSDGAALGALCVIDQVPHAWTADDLAALRDLAGCVVSEIEQRLLANKLTESERRFSTLVEQAPVGIFETDHEGNCRFVNERWQELSGLRLDEARGTGWIRAVHEEDRDRVVREWSAATKHGNEFDQEYRFGDDVRTVWIRATVVALRSLEGTLSGHIGTVLDFTEQRQAESALRASQERFQELLPLPILALDELTIAYANPSARAQFRSFGSSLESMKVTALVDPSDHARLEALLSASEDGELPSPIEIRGRRDNATRVTLEATAAPLPLRGKPMKLLVLRDVTEQKRLQASLMLADRMASVGTLAAGVAHEINNPLTYVIANLEMIAEELSELSKRPESNVLGSLSELVCEARQGANSVRRIVRDLRTFSRADKEQRHPQDVHGVLEVAVNMTANELNHRAQVVRDYGDIPQVDADEARLAQVFINLLVNAAQALPEGERHRHEVRISTRQDPRGQVVVEVNDTGCGIPDRVRDRIFEPFFTTKPVGVGTGLGLSISHNIVHQLGGTIDVASRPGSTTFRVTLPASLRRPPRIDPDSSPPSVNPTSSVLLVDDDPVVVAALKRVLRREFLVTALVDAREVIPRLEAGERYDTVLCDLMMPELSGPELYQRVRARWPEQAERFVFISAGFGDSMHAFLNSVSNPKLEKPFDIEKLRAVLRHHSETLHPRKPDDETH